MIIIKIMERDMIVTTTSRVTSGSVNLPVKFHFKGDEWDDLVKTAVFIGSGEERDVALITDECAVPADVLAEAGGDLKIGVYGRLANGATVIPTIWGRVQYIYEGTEMGEPSPHSPEPDWTAQVQQAAATALTKAQAVEAAAARGDFDGVSPAVTIAEITHGHSVTITDRDHPTGQSFNVMDGDSAYEQAVAGGYTGTEAQFNEALAAFKDLSEQAAGSAAAAAQSESNADASAQDSEAYAIGKRNGNDVGAGDPAHLNNSKYYAEQAGLYMSEAGSDALDAASSMRHARSYANIAQDYAGQATSSASDAATAKTAAEAAQTAAAASASDASDSADSAASSATAASGSATAAASSATAAGNAQTAAETAQGAAEDAQAAAEAVLASIPADYTELSGDVDNLKSATSIYNSVSGAIVSFNDGADAPVKSISIDGAESGVVYRTGKNILSDNYSGGAVRVTNGITYRNTNGAISVDGTSTGDAYYGIAPNTDGQRIKLKAGTYTISCPETTNRCVLNFTIVGVLTSNLNGTTHEYTFSIGTDSEMYANIRVFNSTTINTVLHPQIEVGFEYTGYEQYTGETFNIPSESVTTLEGINNLWSNDGNITLVYLANSKLYIDALDSKYAGTSQEYVYSGAKIEIVPTLRFLKVAGISTGYTQGGACYGNYLFQFHSQNQGSASNHGCSVVDMTTGITVQFISLSEDSLKHNNNASFGPQKYSDSDEFPLLYVSQESANARNCLVYRITGTVGEFALSLIQTINFPASADWGATYPNCCVGNDGFLYIIGSRSGSYEALKYQLPPYSSAFVSLNYADKLSQITFSSPLGVQGFLVYSDKLYFTCGNAASSRMLVVDLQNGEIKSTVDFNSVGLSYEPEAIYLYNNYLHITFNTGGGTIYKFMF